MARPDINISKAQKFNLKRINHPCIVEEKLSGHRMVLKEGYAYGRSPDTLGIWRNKWDTLPPHIQNLAVDEWVDGELIWPHHDDSEVVTGLNEHPSEMEFVAFALPERYGRLYPDEHLINLRHMGFRIPFFIFGEPKGITHPEYFKATDKLISDLLSLARKKKWEGFVLKQRMRQPCWWKLKVTHTYDLIMTGWTIATAGKHKGMIKSIKGSVTTIEEGGFRNIEVANVSGMKDEIRYNITEADLGRVFEVEANLLAGQGRLRHPRFIRWRDDKSATECTYESEIGNKS